MVKREYCNFGTFELYSPKNFPTSMCDYICHNDIHQSIVGVLDMASAYPFSKTIFFFLHDVHALELTIELFRWNFVCNTTKLSRHGTVGTMLTGIPTGQTTSNKQDFDMTMCIGIIIGFAELTSTQTQHC